MLAACLAQSLKDTKSCPVNLTPPSPCFCVTCSFRTDTYRSTLRAPSYWPRLNVLNLELQPRPRHRPLTWDSIRNFGSRPVPLAIPLVFISSRSLPLKGSRKWKPRWLQRAWRRPMEQPPSRDAIALSLPMLPPPPPATAPRQLPPTSTEGRRRESIAMLPPSIPRPGPRASAMTPGPRRASSASATSWSLCSVCRTPFMN